MRADLLPELLATSEGQEAEAILRACVHCGLCTATCPSYQVLGNELDSPRGRIYLLKEALEGAEVSDISLQHLDSCLGCRACETTCPSGVQYHRLFDIGQSYIEAKLGRSWRHTLPRRLLRQLMLSRALFTSLMRLGQWFRPLLPLFLRAQVPPLRPPLPQVAATQERKAILFEGCVQPGLSPRTNEAASLVMNRLGIESWSAVARGELCCGALSYHGGNRGEGLQFARSNIDAWTGLLDAGAESIVFTASGCGAFVQDYPQMLGEDSDYAAPAQRVADAMLDISQLMDGENLSALAGKCSDVSRAVLHCPCTLQHALGVDGVTRRVLTTLGISLPPVRDEHLCCGSAGMYSLFQPTVAGELRDKKLFALSEHSPKVIMTANIGCQKYLGEKSDAEVQHWIEVVARALIKREEEELTL